MVYGLLKKIVVSRSIKLLAISILSTAWLAPLQAADTTPIKTVAVAKNIYLLYGRGGNVAVLTGDDGAIMVDDQFAAQVPLLRDAISQFTDAPLRFVLNTHWHGDHTGGNELLGKADVMIVAHDNVRKRMSTEQFQAHFDRSTPPSPAEALPVVTFSDKVSLHFNGEDIRLIHVPHAHSDGDTMVHFRQANVLHMGDTFFNGNFPFVDISSGGNLNGIIKAAELGLSLTDADSKIIPGHGKLTDRDGLQTYLNMLLGVRDSVQRLVATGLSREMVVAAKPTLNWDADWGNGFINPDAMAGFAYDSLAEQ